MEMFKKLIVATAIASSLVPVSLIRAMEVDESEQKEREEITRGSTIFYDLTSKEQAEIMLRGKEIRAAMEGILHASMRSERELLLGTFIKKYGVDVLGNDASDLNDTTLLMRAAEIGDIELVGMLLDNNADVQKETVSCETAFLKAVRGGNVKIVRMLIERGVDINQVSFFKSEANALVAAILVGNVSMADYLISEGADVNIAYENQMTPLMHAACLDNVDMINLLIDKGARVNYSNSRGKTALMHAVQEDNLKAVSTLIDKGALVDQEDDSGSTPLMRAVFQKENNIVDILIAYGANVNKTDRNGVAPLIAVAFRENVELMMTLIFAGAEYNAEMWDALEKHKAMFPYLYLYAPPITEEMKEMVVAMMKIKENVGEQNWLTHDVVTSPECEPLARQGTDVCRIIGEYASPLVTECVDFYKDLLDPFMGDDKDVHALVYGYVDDARLKDEQAINKSIVKEIQRLKAQKGASVNETAARAQAVIPAHVATMSTAGVCEAEKASTNEAAAVDYDTSCRLAQAEKYAKQNVSAQ